MTILNRYICRRLIFYYFAFIATIIVFFMFVDFMENISRITKEGVPLRLIGLYYIYLMPRIFVETSWFGFLVAILFVLGILAKNNEFTAMLAGGISLYKVGAPLLVIGALLSAGVFCVRELVVPETMLRALEMEQSDFDQESNQGRIFHVAGIGKRNRFYFFDMMDVEAGQLAGVHVHTRKGDAIAERIDAERAVWDDNERLWYLEDGIVRKFDPEGRVLESVSFSRKKAPFTESPKTLEIYSTRRGEFNFQQIRGQIKNLEKSGYDAQRLKVDFHKKFSTPVANLIVVLLGLPFALECRRGGLTIGFGLSLMAALFYYGTFQFGLALGMGDYVPATVSAWMANILFLGAGAGLTVRART